MQSMCGACPTRGDTPLQACTVGLLRASSHLAPESRPALATRMGRGAGELLESAYRLELGLGEGSLEIGEYAALLQRMISGSGGRSSVHLLEDGAVQVDNEHCPFATWTDHPETVCSLAFSVFGDIAARNFGGAKIAVDTLITRQQGRCRYCIYVDAEKARGVHGMEYRATGTRPSASVGRPPVRAELDGTIVARSVQMQRVLGAVQTVGPTSATVLVTGESGTGKELVARALHAVSVRSKGEFVAVNCGAIPEGLLESTLFGHERGAFTGASARHAGLFERAVNGTLFLDEVDSLSPPAQTRLLRVLQEGEFERVGGRQTLATNARVIAATNHSLDEAVAQGSFRMDLLYRLNVVNIHIPPLRERVEDIPPLVAHILSRLQERYGRPAVPISDVVMGKLLTYPWQGNVRELENVLERSLLFCRGPELDCLLLDRAPARAEPAEEPALQTGWKEHRRRILEREEQRYITALLRRCAGSVPEMAETMGLTTRAIYQKLQAYGLDPSAYRH